MSDSAENSPADGGMARPAPPPASARAGAARVSVIIPAYNTAAFIAETLDSVFAQTYRDFEVIVINDGSPDTPEMERVLQPYLDRITYIRQQNAGLAAARNAGIRSACGEYQAFLDSDDAWDAEFLGLQVPLIESQPGVDLVYADLRMIGEGPRAGKTFMEDCPSRGPATFESLLCEVCQAPASGTLARRRAVIEAGLFDHNLRRSEDYDLWLRLTWRGGKVLYRRLVLGTHRLRSTSLSADAKAMAISALRVLTKLDEELPLSGRQRALLRRKKAAFEAALHLEQGKRSLAQGEILQAREHLAQANSFFARFRISLALWGLRFAPRLAGAAIAVWRRILRRRSRRIAA